MGTVSIAVGCAVGIPIGLGVLIALFCWARLQRRYKREEEEDKELENVIHDDNASITFHNTRTLQPSSGWEEKNEASNDMSHEDSEIFDEQKQPDHHIIGSGSFEGSLSHEEKLAGASHGEKGKKGKGDPARKKSKYFVPAYRRKINSMQVNLSPTDGTSTVNSSSTSLTSSKKAPKRQVSLYDQMVPVVPTEKQGLFDQADEKERHSSNENLIKNLNSQDYGSYYPRRASSSSLNQLHSTNHSTSSFHTRASSMNSGVKVAVPSENVFATPKSEQALNAPIKNDEKVEKHDDVYLLKNNYDITNTNEIAEEDQYENEFTNYSENKREFINTLRPKKL